MNFKQGLFQQQSLKLTMTHELSQAIALLQYSSQELSTFLESKALENPFIQVDPTVIPVNPLADRRKKRMATTTTIQNDWLEQIGETKKSIVEHLMAQIPLNEEVKHLRPTIELLIQCIDKNGYLPVGALDDTIPKDTVEKSIAILQSMEPVGIAARSLQECLLIQLKTMPLPWPLAITLVEFYFEPFAEKKWKELAKTLQVSLSDIQKAFDLIQTLNPRPGAEYFSETTAFITPDVIVIWDGNEYSITVFDELLPKISFNQDFYHQYARSDDKELTKYMENQMQNYQWLQKSLEQRKQTLQKVVLKMVEKQADFFKNGPTQLRPMVMKEIADEIDMHESTVSRAVREKYVQTPFGVFELKSFFTSTIQTTSEESTSSSQVKTALSSLINAENKQKPISDQDIVELLQKNDGIVISRRTVAKYRDQLGIPSSSKRRRYDH